MTDDSHLITMADEYVSIFGGGEHDSEMKPSDEQGERYSSTVKSILVEKARDLQHSQQLRHGKREDTEDDLFVDEDGNEDSDIAQQILDTYYNRAQEQIRLATSRRTRPATRQTPRAIDFASLLSDAPQFVEDITDEDVHNAIEKFPADSIEQDQQSDGWRPKGIAKPLRPAQLLALRFILDREAAGDGIKGGILADALGMGKTAVILSAIAHTKMFCQAGVTLIVAPNTLMEQCLAEVKKFVIVWPFTVVCVKGKDFENAELMKKLAHADLIVTNYQAVSKSWPKYAPPPDADTEEARQKWWTAYSQLAKGPLHRIQFHRVVLDEAHALRNAKSHVTKACTALESNFHWSVSATPIVNGLAELFPHFRILNVPTSAGYQEFVPKSRQTILPLRALLSKIMLQRKHHDKLLGSPLLDLPLPTYTLHKTTFGHLHRILYDTVRNRCRQRIEALSVGDVAHTAGQKHTLFTLLLRLRMLADHPLLIHDTLKDLLEQEDFETLQRVLALTVTSDEEEQRTLQCLQDLVNSDSSPHYSPYLKTVQSDAADPTPPCSSCVSNLKRPCVTACGHVYCNECMAMLLAAAQDSDAQCLACAETIYESQVNWAVETNPKAKIRSDMAHLVSKWVDAKGHLLPSAKTIAFESAVRTSLHNGANKIVAFSNFRTMIKILQRMCEKNGWQCMTFTGDDTTESRDLKLKLFRTDETVVLLSSMGVGGAGLNMTMASSAILVDPWWNTACEEQAFGRIHRFGQTKPTQLFRLLVEGSVEDKMQAIKARKDAAIAQVSGDEARSQRFTDDELRSLFNP